MSRYIPIHKMKGKMLEEIGYSSIEELFGDIPKEIRLDKDMDIPGPMSEMELIQHERTGIL